jgi:hypothetical protein
MRVLDVEVQVSDDELAVFSQRESVEFFFGSLVRADGYYDCGGGTQEQSGCQPETDSCLVGLARK